MSNGVIITAPNIKIVVATEPAISYSDIGSPEFTFQSAIGRIDGVRHLKCAWANRVELMVQLLGWVEVQGNGLVVYLPQPFPAPGLQACIARSVRVTNYYGGPEADTTQPATIPSTRVAAFELAQLTVNYSTHLDIYGQSVRDSGQIWRRESIKGSAELTSIPNNGTLSWSNNSIVPVDGSEIPGYMIHRSEWSYSRKFAGLPPTWLLDYVNYVNASELVSPTFGNVFAPETLKLMAPQFNVETDINGNTMSDVTISFLHQPDGWNMFPYMTESGIIVPSNVYYKSSGQQVKPFPSTDAFDSLIV
jgi:hypothetical protein